jgi:drug/metabolite transporter (DMT)-like permease
MNSFLSGLGYVHHIGEVFSLLSALLWAVAVILFRISGRSVHPYGLNLFKNVLSLALLTGVLEILHRPLFLQVPPSRYGLFLLSGFLGIAVSDTLFFMALNILGAGLTAIVDCFYSPFIIFLSFAFLGEKLNAAQMTGILLIIGAVLTIAWTSRGENSRLSKPVLWRGIMFGILAMFFVAVGIVIIKPALARTDVLWATEIRLAGGVIGLVPIIAFHRKKKEILRPLFRAANWKVLVSGSVFGSFFSLIFWVGGMKYALASVAGILNQMTTIFIFILAALFLKEKATPRKIIAVILAFAGAFIASSPF